jgi:hypothetical protein
MIRHRPVLPALLPSLLLALLLAPLLADARMYQWVSQASGSQQLSGQPPPWYRSAQGGPRVRVFDNGNLVDDTAIELPRNQREELREAAFEESEQRQRAEALKRLERAARREQLHREETARLEQVRRERSAEQAQRAAGTPQQDAAGQASGAFALPSDGRLDDDTVARLKAIIGEYDRRGGSIPPR